MQTKWTSGLAVVLIALAGTVAVATLQPDGSEHQAVEQASQQFYSALNALFTGDVNPMKDVWSHADDVTYMGPDGGFQVGWPAVVANWENQAGRKLGGRIRPTNVHMIIAPGLAVVQCYEKGENEVDGKPQKVSIRATNVFRRENGKWKMVSHQTDILPFLKQTPQ